MRPKKKRVVSLLMGEWMTMPSYKTNRLYLERGSKKLAEAAAWEYVQSVVPPANFILSTILPPMIYGPLFSSPTSSSQLNTSSADIYRLMNGSLNTVPSTPMPAFVDVRDVATAHVLAFERSIGGRYLVSGGDFTYGEVCKILREALPAISERIPQESSEDGDHYQISTTRASSTLGMKFRGMRECFEDMGRKFVELEERQKSSEG